MNLDGLPTPRRHWAGLTIWLAITMAVLDESIAIVALPTISAQIAAPASLSIWIVNSYQLAIAILSLPLAALGDRIGYRRVYVPGLIVFVLGSIACALSRTLATLIASRMFQGVGAAAIFSMNAALVRETYPAAKLGRVIGINSLVVSVSFALGPTIAAGILSIASWPWLFAINVPIGIAALLSGRHALPHTSGHGMKPDYIAAVLSALAMGALILGCGMLSHGDPHTGAPLLVMAVIAGFALVRRERTRAAPLLPLDLLRIPVFALSIATSLVAFAAQMLTLVTLPFLLQNVMKMHVLETGLLLSVWPIALGICGPIAGRLADRYPAGMLGGIGLMVFALGLLLLSRLDAQSGTAAILVPLALCGAGFGFFQTPNNRTLMMTPPRARSGAAGGALSTARVLGQTLGAVVVAGGFHWLGVEGSATLLLIGAGAALVSAGTSLLRLRI
ncbi:MAG: MFS transporter [Steroidobacteraceae bacterium]